jgi:uncharacterized protein (DUF1810 family)
MAFDLDRFKRAQDARHAGQADALAEMRGGRKTSHWIWYVFPQLGGLGHSPNAVRYGLDGPDEAAAYLADPVLAGRLRAVTAAARAHLAPAGGAPPARIEALLGSAIDASKLISSMTLFARVARALRARGGGAELGELADDAEAILAAAAAQGHAACAFTDARLRAAGW